MPGLDDVLERLINDAGFRGRLAADPAGALAGYDLSSEDLALLASQVTDGAGASGAVEARTSRASLVGFMSAFGDVAEALSPAANAIPTETITMNFEEIKVTYDPEAGTTAGDLAATESPAAPAPHEEVPLTYQKVELEHVKPGGDPPATADLAAAGDDPNARGDVDGRDFLVWQRSNTPPVDGSDVLAWDVGDGSDAAAKGEQIELQSWAPSTPPAQADVGPLDDEVEFAYKAIKFNYDTSEPDALATPEGGPEPTGPIADVLYSAAGNSGPDGAPAGGSAGFHPVVGDWNGDAATLDGDSSDGRDFAAWQRQYGHESPDAGSPVLSVGDEPSMPPDGTGPGSLAEGTADPEPMAVKLENVQITSYQIGVLDDADPDLRAAADLPADAPGAEPETT